MGYQYTVLGFMEVSHLYTYTVDSRNYAPPPLCTLALGNSGGGDLYAGSLHFCVMTITSRRMPCGRTISTFSGCLMGKTDKVRHNITQIAGLLAVATVFIGLWTLQSGRGGGLLRETKLPMQELELKVQRGLCTRGGRNCGILWCIMIICDRIWENPI